MEKLYHFLVIVRTLLRALMRAYFYCILILIGLIIIIPIPESPLNTIVGNYVLLVGGLTLAALVVCEIITYIVRMKFKIEIRIKVAEITETTIQKVFYTQRTTYTIAALLVVIITLIVPILSMTNFFGTDYYFECTGQLHNNNSAQQKTIEFKIEKYNILLKMISGGSDGRMLFMMQEHGTTKIDFYRHIIYAEDQFQIYEKFPQKLFKGSFSELDNTISVDTAFGFFKGTCAPTN